MKFVNFAVAGAERFGAMTADGRLLDLEGTTAARLARDMPRDRALTLARALTPPEARDFIATGRIALDAAKETLDFAETELRRGDAPTGPSGETILFEASAVRILAPVPRPRKFIAAGKNYFAHQQEMQQRAAPVGPQLPIAHVQFASTIVGPGETVHFPKETKHMDYEVEIAAVIGRPAFNVARDEALGFVFGYTIFNDITDRDMYRGENREGGGIGLLGKNFAGFAPLGPVLCTRDEIGDPQKLALRTRVNGETRQDSTADLMMFKIDEQIAHWSRIGLEPGDILGTGTPGGVAAGRKPEDKPWWLKRGDRVECEIERIGILTTTIA
ncbi:MAG TPA: fumarylacetoacetate hydrolase family protein [Stellaceae bacterium]|nr:fumarylacetoacetate hydrolase family protein [Stellaceae bacterium]